MKVLTIDRAKWKRGLPTENATCLLDSVTDMMCCLGFEALACGLARVAIASRSQPGYVDPRHMSVEYIATHFDGGPGMYNQNIAVSNAIRANDDYYASEADRERDVTTALKQLGWDDVVFIN